MRFTTNYIIIFFLISFSLSAQDKKAKKLNKPKVNYHPTEARFGTDVISLAATGLKSNFERAEFNGDIDFHHYLLNLDVGYEKESFANQASNRYTVDGTYMKIGVDRSLSVKNPSNSDIFLGFRYALGRYSDQLSYVNSNPIYGANELITVSTDDIRARWLELTFGMKVNMLKHFAIGYTWRLKFASKVKDNVVSPNKIPGYGSTLGNNNIGFNFYFLFRLPVKKETKSTPAPEQ